MSVTKFNLLTDCTHHIKTLNIWQLTENIRLISFGYLIILAPKSLISFWPSKAPRKKLAVTKTC